MPAIWSSSERPISVKTVWVNGIRHAILSQDDPILEVRNQRRRTQTKNLKKSNECQEILNPSIDSLDSCFIKFHLLTKKKLENENVKVTRRQSAPLQTTSDEFSANLLDLPLSKLLKISRNSINEIRSESSRYFKEDTNELNKIPCDEELCKLKEIHSNPLSERVFHWMDMSGRVKDYTKSIESDDDNHHNILKSRYCILKKQNLIQPFKQLNIQNCKLIKCKKSDEVIEEKQGENNVNIGGMEDNSEVKESGSYSQNKTVWAPLGRRQLHIFMPDLNSKEDDTLSQDSNVDENN